MKKLGIEFISLDDKRKDLFRFIHKGGSIYLLKGKICIFKLSIETAVTKLFRITK